MDLNGERRPDQFGKTAVRLRQQDGGCDKRAGRRQNRQDGPEDRPAGGLFTPPGEGAQDAEAQKEVGKGIDNGAAEAVRGQQVGGAALHERVRSVQNIIDGKAVEEQP